jgi:Fe-S oxidoreductase
MIANFTASSKLASIAPGVYNFMMTNPATSRLIKKTVGFAAERSMPTLYKTTLRNWYRKHKKPAGGRKVYLFCDEFTNYNDTEIGIKAIELLEKLGYDVQLTEHEESGRTWLSKGLIREAQKIINRNIEKFSPIISAETPLVGIEPSAILTFRDEYPDLASEENYDKAVQLSTHVLMIDEFLAMEMEKGHIKAEQFSSASKKIMLHGHCQQKSVASVAPTVKILSFPANYSVQTIPSGCCGMAGSFGYEEEHYELSMKIGELVLFPTVRKQENDTIIAAPGTSCRHQIKDGTGRKAMHPVEILWEAAV